MVPKSNDGEMMELDPTTLERLQREPQSTMVAKSSRSTTTNRKWKMTRAPSWQRCKEVIDLVSEGGYTK
ncbi:LysR family transcriptional regulator [Sesbania bispinosa]|nr:LysR family transcriptional regulator [Sesbania bispinosa]